MAASTSIYRSRMALAVACLALSLPGAGLASDGSIEFRGAIVAPTLDPTTTISEPADATASAVQVQRSPLREALRQHVALLDYFATQVPTDRAAVITVSYN